MKTTATAKTIQSIINKYSDSDGWTYYFGDKKRYVVAFTHNKNPEMLLLQNQLTRASTGYENLTIGGWTDSNTEIEYIDIGMTTDNIEKAMDIATIYNQIAIRDNEEMREIRL